MNFQEELNNKREQYHISIRYSKTKQDIISNRKRFIETICKFEQSQIIPFQVAINNVKDNINLQKSIEALSYWIRQTEVLKDKYKMIMTIVDKGILQKLKQSLFQKKALLQIIHLVASISSIQGKHTGNYIIRSGIMLPLIELAQFNNDIYIIKLLTIFGNMCQQSAQNRNILGDAEIHLSIIQQLKLKIMSCPTIYTQNSLEEEIRLWDYKFWFLISYYGYDIPGDNVPHEFIQILLLLIKPQVPSNILKYSLRLLGHNSSFIDIKDLQILSTRIQPLIASSSKDSEYTLDLIYLIANLPTLCIHNLQPLLKFYNPSYYGDQQKQNRCPSFITRILFSRLNQLDQLAQLHRSDFWYPIINKSLRPIQKQKILKILSSINIQNVQWIMQYFYDCLNQNNDSLEILSTLNFIIFQIERQGKSIIGTFIQKYKLDTALLKLQKSQNIEIYKRVKTILDLYS